MVPLIEIFPFDDCRCITKNILPLINTNDQNLKLAISGGSIVSFLVNLFEIFTSEYPFPKLQVAVADERIIDPFIESVTEINGFQLNSALSNFVSIIQVPQHNHASDLVRIAMEYDRLVTATLGEKDFNFIFLGVGSDGHCASLFPGMLNFDTLDTCQYIPILASPKPPSNRISLSLSAILNAQFVVFVIPYSFEKKDTIHKIGHILSGSVSYTRNIFPSVDISLRRKLIGKKTIWMIASKFYLCKVMNTKS